MHKTVIAFNQTQREDKFNLRSGDVVRVHRLITEGSKERTQIFEGMIIAIRGGQSSSPMITVRKVSNGVGIEIVVPVFSPHIAKVELVKRAKVRRAKLYYVRDKPAKKLRFAFTDADNIKAPLETEGVVEDTEVETIASEADTTEVITDGKGTDSEGVEKVSDTSSISSETTSGGSVDDLTKIEGIGPVIAKTLIEGGIATFAQLADAKDEDVQAMIADVKGNHRADTWNEQSALARDGKWDDLKKWQDELDGGKEVS